MRPRQFVRDLRDDEVTLAGLTDAQAVGLPRAALARVWADLSAVGESVLRAPGLGRFRLRVVGKRNGAAREARLIRFRLAVLAGADRV